MLGILFISFNLRAPITAVGSIVEMIQEEYALSSAAAGFITTLPLIAFAMVSPFVAKISNKIGHSNTMMIGLVFILIDELVRSFTGVFGLFIVPQLLVLVSLLVMLLFLQLLNQIFQIKLAW